MAVVTLVRRLAAAGSLSMLLAVATAPLAAAHDHAPPAPPACEVLVILPLPCEVGGLPPAPMTDLPVEPLVPGLTQPIDELVPGHVTVLVPAAAAGHLPPVLNIGSAQATDVPAATVADVQPAVDPPAVQGDGTPATPEATSHRQDDLNAPPTVATAATAPATAPATASWRQLDRALLDGASERLAAELPATEPPIAPAVAITLTLGGGAALAVELARGGGSWAGAVAFNVWLRRQLREAHMSQRQLAVVSGVDHSTISRLMSGRREPSLATATKITEALRKLNGMPHAGEYFAVEGEAPVLPTKRVEAALLGDEELDDTDVRELMQAYLVARARRRRERNSAASNGESIR